MAEITEHLSKALAGRYTVERELGAGGMATVYLAHDVKHNRKVAIKVLRPELAAAIGAERFLKEIEVTANLQHPHILPLFDSGEADSLVYYVMPFVEGESLRDRLNRDGPLPIADALAITKDIAAALTHAHAHDVIHRDIKPDNILLEDGEALVADFGIALAFSAAGKARLTATGLSLGTPAYMSPEQIGGEPTIDGRSDVYALGCLLYEMLTGSPPFTGPNAQAIIAAALADPAPSVRDRRADIPAAIDVAITTALAKRPEGRFESPRAFYDACRVSETVVPTGRPLARLGVGVAVFVLAIAAFLSWGTARVSKARASLAEIASLAADGNYVDAYDRAVRAERVLGDDSVLADLMFEVSDLLSVTTEPAGASVFLQPYAGGTDGAPDSQLVGVTPLRHHRVPRIDHRVVLALVGFQAVERIASSALDRSMRRYADSSQTIRLALTLQPLDKGHEGLVFVPGGEYTMTSPDIPPGLSARLDDFLIDRFEVTNAAYQRFVMESGYANPTYWSGANSTVRSTLVDRTGLPGPRHWVGQAFPDGKDRYPVTGITWLEATAYCRSVGKRLPTVYEWEKTARDGRVSLGVLMPWGYMSSTGPSVGRANFAGSGSMPVDAFPFGISPYGAYAMAGNVKEWTANPMGDGYVVTGGSWEDPAYLYTEFGSQPASHSSMALGFRCARTVSEARAAQGEERIEFELRTPVYSPVDRTAFRSLLAHYRYDPRPANARMIESAETEGWTRERIWIDGVESDSVLLYFYTPTGTPPPFQTIVFVPGSDAFCCRTLVEHVEWAIGPAIRAGRAVLAVVLEGMVERGWGPGYTRPPTNSVRFRDQMVRHATELRLGMDYLATRGDVNMDLLAYVAVSFGAGSRLGFAAVDDRYKAVVFIGGGIDERMKPTLPEADNVNFAPYIDVPKLLLNGRNDEEHPWLTRALPLWNLLSEPKKLVLVDGAGHVPPLEARIPAINDFLDETLGPVQAHRRP